jgi:hypothetical protein
MSKEGIKFDDNKLRYDLVPVGALKGLTEVITYGAKKYAPDNWKLIDKERYVAATMRHFEAWRGGEQCDEESGFNHLYHVMANIAFLIEKD